MLRKLHEILKHKGHFIFFFIYVIVFLWAIISSLYILKSKNMIFKSKAQERDFNRDVVSDNKDDQRLKNLNYLQEKFNNGGTGALSDKEWEEYYMLRSNGRANAWTQPDNYIFDPATRTWRQPGPGDDSSFNSESGSDINLGSDRTAGSANPAGGGGGNSNNPREREFER